MALIGPGVAKLKGEVLQAAARFIPVHENIHRPHTPHMARLAWLEWHGKPAPDIRSLAPVYGLEFGGA
jgi:hypothetical protein